MIARDGAIIFGDLIDKLDVLHVACEKCGRKGRYAVAGLIAESRFNSIVNLTTWFKNE